MKKICFSILSLLVTLSLYGEVQVGLDRLFEEPFSSLLKNKRVGLVTNQSAVNSLGKFSFDLLIENQKALGYKLRAAFAPEHGLDGKLPAFAHIKDSTLKQVPVYSLHGSTKRPTEKMLENLDVIIYDIQNVGVRCYTYETTLFYVMEEAAKLGITVLVLDRPNPRGGVVVEGLGVEEKFRCFFSYADIPFCHGMTIGELAGYFNAENQVGCTLKVVPMKGWDRNMEFSETGLPWVPPSPNIPDAATTLVYPSTIFLGETLEIVSVDLRGEHPFKRIGAPWISSDELAPELCQMDLPGILFCSHAFTPKWGKYAGIKCEGVFLKVTNEATFQPLLTQYIIFEKLIELYPEQFDQQLKMAIKKGRRKTCNYLSGSNNLLTAIESHSSVSRDMKALEELQSQKFLEKRLKYLRY